MSLFEDASENRTLRSLIIIFVIAPAKDASSLYVYYRRRNQILYTVIRVTARKMFGFAGMEEGRVFTVNNKQ